ncbi:hypothetical protein FEK33_04900 [Nocardia asteroides NBRC 15531]|uniref:Uncharacterized protein n=1 Tax=Nocardia asteroides NBRC 15531 TaxID=1110697 RepID=U5E456_NOCAS|nr:hypothetical protein [Nocardia asteroides]TLF69627.1 hypothetical protein FEK33_04900 [Nocardia asteroides NBRC 15531]UGT49128.1 hypothetical protein LT345_00380 [Nocardia asteroides]SFL81236.1 hypothetical protein SAMN05444423_101997 [Nocardia asteroides]VEG31083.1 Uncharacterised protein [Nocardia asteroides]GAD83697.1 hypothetical protein NCAST_20_02660 [Nocardia asteroides NBRC 15531]
MSGEDSKQLSVAELLARNAAQGATPSSGGGGRRRRSGRGLSVNDLTGENAAVRPNSHAAPAPEPPAYQPPLAPAPSYEPPAAPAPYPPPGPAEPAFSPMSGPITRFDPHSGFSAPDPHDPLGVAGQRPANDPFGPFRAEARDAGTRSPGRLGAPGSAQPVDPGIAEMFGSGAQPAVGGGRRRKPDPEETPEPPAAPPVTGGRAARRRAAEAAEAAEEAAAADSASFAPTGYDAFGSAPEPPRGPSTASPFGPYQPFDASEVAPSYGQRPDPAPGFGGPGFGQRPDDNIAQAYAPMPGAPAPQRGTGWPPAPESDQRPSLDRRRSAPEAEKSGGLPSWSARRHRPDAAPAAPESGGFPTAAWSPVSQEQPLIAGQSVAGDLLRQRADQDDNADARTEVYRVGGKRGGADPDTDDYAESEYTDRDYVDNDYSDSDYADGEYDTGDFDEYDDDYEPEPKPSRASRRAAATKAAASKMAGRARSRAASRVAASRASGRAGSRMSRLTAGAGDDANRRQWMILAGQSVGAAIAGMLLFKGFETMWETLPWVALALAMVVILGLVALVRVLRRTDDIFSTVIAVVVGVFVTLGPLAFLLSTS